jgi:hypothetical protein
MKYVKAFLDKIFVPYFGVNTPTENGKAAKESIEIKIAFCFFISKKMRKSG